MPITRSSHRCAAGLCAIAAAALTGCATYSHDGGFDAVASGARRERGADIRWVRSSAERRDADAQVADLLGRPLALEDAVQLALLNNRDLQASFERLRISEAQMVRAGRLPNPSFTYGHAQAGGLYNIEERLSFNLIALFSLPYVHGTEQRRFAAEQQATLLDVTRLCDATRRAYYTALAARDSLGYAEHVADAAAAGGELAQRMQRAGNWNEIEAANEYGFAIRAQQQLAHARLADVDATEALTRLLGIDTTELGVDSARPGFTLAEHLPELPAALDAEAPAEQLGLDSRIDLKIERLRLEELARGLHLTQATRFIDVLDAGPTRIRDGTRNDPYEHGFQVTLEIPLFDGGGSRLREAQGEYARAADRFAQAAVRARSQIRAAYARVKATYEVAARQRAQTLPLQNSISEQNLLRYNAAQISVFQLLADARARIDAYDAYIASVRDYWVAKSALDSALSGDTAPTDTVDSTRG